MNTPHYDDALHMMERLGGSFVRSLADCYYRADPPNRVKLRSTFAEYFDKYERQYAEWVKRTPAPQQPGEGKP